MRIRYFCHYGALTGYGRAARDYLAALERVDEVDLEIAVWGERLTSPEPRYEHLDELAVPYDQVVGIPDVEIYHGQPRFLEALTRANAATWALSPDVKRVALTTWETDQIPDLFADAIAKYDAVIVPSEFCHDVIGSHETTLTVPRIVPHCFDEDFWPAHQPTPAFLDAGAAEGAEPFVDMRPAPFRFYSIGAWGERKNNLGIIRAYLHAFTSADPVQLMILCPDADLNEVRSLVARSGIAPDDMPELYVPQHEIDEAQLVELHATSDCFVSATRCEGWGLGLFEAAISGRMIISPIWGGQIDFLDDYGGARAVPYHLTPCFGSERREQVVEAGVTIQVSRVAIPPGVNAKQCWADPDLMELARSMRSVYESREQPLDYDPRKERVALEQKFGYKTVGPLMVCTLKEILEWEPEPLSRVH
jgi:hypothetical protein